jgi:hypothetical protein
MEVLVATIEKRTFTHTSFPKHRGPGRPPSSHIALHAKAAEHFLCNVAHTLAPCTVGLDPEYVLRILWEAKVLDSDDRGI